MNYKNLHSQLSAYPHIQQRLDLFWGEPECRRYLSELMMPERTDRQGFPFEINLVLQNLLVLHDRTWPELVSHRESRWEFMGRHRR